MSDMANVIHKENLGVVINMLSHLYKDGMNFSVMHTLHKANKMEYLESTYT